MRSVIIKLPSEINIIAYLVKTIKIISGQYFPVFCHSCVQPTTRENRMIFQFNIGLAVEAIELV